MKKIKKIFKVLGPGFITGASDDDPAGIAAYSQTGAQFGFGQTWTAIFSFPLMAAVQEMCGRIGLVTGKGLAGVIKKHYSASLLYFAVSLLFIANTINIGADLGAMAASAQLIVGLPFVVWLFIIVIVTLGLEIFVSYKTYAAYLKFLTLALLAYIATAFIVKVDWVTVYFLMIVPQFVWSKEYLVNIVAIFGTTISPYLFFWQTSEEVEEQVVHHRLRQMGAGQPKIYPYDLSNLRNDTLIGMFFSNLVMFFIIVTTGATLFASGVHNIESTQQAALALKPLAGDFAFLLFALGIIGTGLLAVPVLAGSASYAVSEALGWREGLYRSFGQAKGFYSVILIATLIGFILNFIGINPIKALYYSAVVNGIIAPALLVLIILIANNKKIMDKRVNSRISNVLGGITIAIMSLASLALLWITVIQ